MHLSSRVTRLLFSLFILCLPVICGLVWLLYTESGLQWAFRQAQSNAPGELAFGEVSGSLSGPLHIKALDYQQADGFSLRVKALDINWQFSALLATRLAVHIQSPVLTLPPEQADNGNKVDSDAPFSLPDFSLPLSLDIDALQIDDLLIQATSRQDASTPKPEALLALQQIKLHLKVDDVIAIKSLSVKAEQFSFTLAGQVRPRDNYPHNVSLAWQVSLPVKQGAEGVEKDVEKGIKNSHAVETFIKLQGDALLEGDLAATRLVHNVRGDLQAELTADINALMGALRWRVALDVLAPNLHQLNPAWPVLDTKLHISGAGDRQTAKLQTTLKGRHLAIGPFEARATVLGARDKTLEIETAEIKLPQSESKLKLSGKFDLEGKKINADLAWENLVWPLLPEQKTVFNSARGQGQLSGQLDDYQLSLHSNSPWSAWALESWQLKAQGNQSGLVLDDFQANILSGVVVATGNLQWAPTLSGDVSLQLLDINPEALSQAWPGKLSMQASLHGERQEEELQPALQDTADKQKWLAQITVNTLSGTLRGQPISAHTDISLRDKTLTIAALKAELGSAKIQLEGQVGGKANLDWQVNAPNLLHVHPDVKGSLKAAGSIRGKLEKPFVKATIAAEKIAWQEFQLASLEGALAADIYQWKAVDVDLVAHMLRQGDTSLDLLKVNAKPESLGITLQSGETSADIALHGKVDNDAWRGQITRADLRMKQGNWTLKHPSGLLLSGDALRLDETCFYHRQEARICARIRREKQAGGGVTAAHKLSSALKIEQVPMAQFSFLLPNDAELEGLLSGEANFILDDSGEDAVAKALTGQVQLSFPEGRLYYPLAEGGKQALPYRDGRLKIRLQKEGVHAALGLSFNSEDQLSFKADLPAAQLLTLDPASQALRAEAKVTIQDMRLIEALVPDVKHVKGELLLDLAAKGTLLEPKIQGNVDWNEGRLDVPALGLSIDQLNIHSEINAQQELSFLMRANSESGHLSLAGQVGLDSQAGWPADITIKGEDFVVANIPQARVLINPDLRLRINDGKANLEGDLHIPYARLEPKDVTLAENVSDDVVFTGEEAVQKEAGMPITTRVRVSLGERVNFSGYSFDGLIGGNLLVIDAPGQLTTATGEITISEGRYRAYGQHLDIDQGRLLYTGGPVTNPGLNVRAIREVDDVIAGLNIRGTLSEPDISLFSLPAMGETETLSYLLLGKPLSGADSGEGSMMSKAALALALSGGDRMARSLGKRFGMDDVYVDTNGGGDQASLVLGRYLSPKIYVSYGVGLVEAINTFGMRYKISDSWQLKGESGIEQGMDLFYTLER